MLVSEERIKVELTPEQAALFVLFQGQYESIGFMFKEQIFNIRGGSATLNFDKAGHLKSIKKEVFAYYGDN